MFYCVNQNIGKFAKHEYMQYVLLMKMKQIMNFNRIAFIAIVFFCCCSFGYSKSYIGESLENFEWPSVTPQKLMVKNDTTDYDVTVSDINVKYTRENIESPGKFKNMKPKSKPEEEVWKTGWISWTGTYEGEKRPLKLKVTLSKDGKEVYSKNLVLQKGGGTEPLTNDTELSYGTSNERQHTSKYKYADWNLTFKNKT